MIHSGQTPNLWFPVALSTLAVPTKSNRLDQLVEDNWAKAKAVTSLEVLKAFRDIGQLGAFAEYDDEQVWATIQARRGATQHSNTDEALDLKGPEWEVVSQPGSAELTENFRLRRSSHLQATLPSSLTWFSWSVCVKCGLSSIRWRLSGP